MDLPTPSHDHSVGAAVALAVSKFADIVRSSLRRRQRADQDALYQRIAEKMGDGFAEVRGMLSEQNADLRELRVRQEGLVERVTKLETAVATIRGER